MARVRETLAYLRRPRSIAVPVVAFVALAIFAGVGWAVTGTLLVLVLWIANGFREGPTAARHDFFERYARERGLKLTRMDTLAEVTPFLSQGDARYAEQIMEGLLPGGVAGILAHFTYEDHTLDAQGGVTVQAHRYTIVVQNLVDVATRLDELYCEPRSGHHFRDAARARKRKLHRLELESVAVDERYEIFFSERADELWLKRLFVPSFIVWLDEEAPRRFAFEVYEGHLCAYAPGHYDVAEYLDAIAEAASAVGDRMAYEAVE